MSVRVNERSQGDLQVLVKAKELATHTIQITNNEKYFPKRYRLSVVNKMQDKAFEIVTNLIEANEIYPKNTREYEYRRLLQRKALASCRALGTLIDISKELFNLPSDKCEYWIKMVFEVRIMAVAWLNKDQENFKYLIK